MTSGVTLSSATRANLLALQGTADLVSTTQNRLSTGKKVNSAIDNASNFFTASSLSTRSSALSTLLDGISNGIQTIQAASQGITSITKLTAQLKSTAQQALASSNSFTSKNTVTSGAAVSVDATGKLLGGATTAASTTGTNTFTGGTLTGFTPKTAASSTSTSNLGAATTVPTKQSVTYSGAGTVYKTAATVTGTAATADDTALQGKTGTISLDDGNGHTSSYTITGSSTKGALTTALAANGYSASFDATTNVLKLSRDDGANFTATSDSTALTTATSTDGITEGAADQLTLTVNGHTATFKAVKTGANAGNGTYSDGATLAAAINANTDFGNASATGVANKIHASFSGGKLQIDGGDEGTSFDFSGTGASHLFTAASGTAGTALQAFAGQTLSLNDGNGHIVNYAVTKTSKQSDLTTALTGSGYTAAIDGTTHFLSVSRSDGQNFSASGPLLTTSTNGVTDAAADKFSLTVGGTTVNFGSVAAGANPSGAGTFTTLSDLVSAINNSSIGAASATSGKVTASISSDKLVLTSGDTTTSFTASGTGATKLGVATTAVKPTQGALTGSLNVAVGDAVSSLITFGAGGVQTLDDLNAQLDKAGAQATIGTDGKLNITTTNENGAEALKISGSIAQTVFGAATATTDVNGTGGNLSGDGKTARDKLVKNYNDLRDQIDQLSQDAGFNGVNLLNGDTVKVIFNEKNTSSVSIKGVATDSTTLGLGSLQSVDFSDARQINKVLTQISSANDTLGSLAATFGTNLSVVQNRQDFSKSLINILDTGAANLTDADLNEEAANSQALTTRQSLGISALSLANQAQQGILQLLR